MTGEAAPRPLWAPPEPYEIWAWVELDETGREGVIAAFVPDQNQFAGPMVLQSRTRNVAQRLEPIARAHGNASRHKVRLVHLSEVPW